MTSISAFQTTRKISQINAREYDKDINPVLGSEEIKTGTNMGMNSHADTTCVNKHAFVESVIEVVTVDAVPIDDSIGKISDLPIVHAIYAYDDPESLRTFLLQFNNAIYNNNNKMLYFAQTKQENMVQLWTLLLRIWNIQNKAPSRYQHLNTSSTFNNMVQQLACNFADQRMKKWITSTLSISLMSMN